MEHVPPEVFGEDYLYFYDAVLTDELSDAQAESGSRSRRFSESRRQPCGGPGSRCLGTIGPLCERHLP